VILLLILVGINVLATKLHYGLDLTKEKRFTLTPATKNMLRNMDDVATVEVYLEGKFPAGIEQLKNAVRDRLNNFNNYAGNKIIYSFTDPFEGKTEAEKGDIFQQLVKKGIIGRMLNMDEESGSTQKMFFPYALVNYKGREISVSLMEPGSGYDPMTQLSISESMLEYKLASAIHKLEMPDRPTIAYITGHGEPLDWTTYDMLHTLENNYRVDTFDLIAHANINPTVYNAIIINRPWTAIKEEEKFKIDQYIMYGGRVLWVVDPLITPLDSLQTSDNIMTVDRMLNLDDMLFNYGVRLNPNLIEDMQCFVLPVTVGRTQRGEAQIENKPWMYYPIFVPTSKHPIVNNMDGILGKFASSIDTVGNPNAKKVVLLESSKYSRTAANPVRVNLAMLQYQLREDMFQKPYNPVAVLLEGKFTSIYRNRVAPSFVAVLRDSLRQPFKEKTDTTTAMIVIADGDMFANDFSESRGPIPMGVSRNSDARFVNSSFLLNCMEYLTDKNSLLEARTKDVKLRLLDNGRTKEEANKWKIVNVGIPIVLVLVFASVYMFFRKRRYEVKQ
jgi:gliding-associated putative ABC transporter substrate-binding component GldG